VLAVLRTMRTALIVLSLLSAAACHNAALGPDGTKPCSDLTTLDECEADPSCAYAGCPSCEASTTPSFEVCYTRGDTPPAFGCPGGCPGPVTPDCASSTSQAACDTTTGCYSVLTTAHPEPCSNSGCSVGFDHCANGPAMCSTAEACTGTSQPQCPTPYANDYDPTTNCIVGCVALTACSMN
jgi:hypothetical protein